MKSSETASTRGKRRKDYYIGKTTKGVCGLCKLKWPSDVLCFHHLNPDNKLFELQAGTGWGKHTLEKCIDEAAKCAILCMNCHTLEHTALRRGESLIGNEEAYIRYRNHSIASYESVDGGDDGPEDRRGTKLSLSV